MPHNDHAKHARRRAAFTGEDPRTAAAALARQASGSPGIPAALPEQAALEADIFSWLARPYKFSYHPFHIRALTPRPERLDLHVDDSPTSTRDLLACTLPALLDNDWSTGVLGLRITAWHHNGVTLQRPGAAAVIRLHGAPEAVWRTAVGELAEPDDLGVEKNYRLPWHTDPGEWTAAERRADRDSPSRYDPISTWLTSGLLRRIRIFKSVVPLYGADGWPTRDTHQRWKFDLACYSDLDPCVDHLRLALTDPDYGLPLSARILRDPDRLDLRAVGGGPGSLLLHFSKCSPGSYWARDPARAQAVRAHAESVASQPSLFPSRGPDCSCRPAATVLGPA